MKLVTFYMRDQEFPKLMRKQNGTIVMESPNPISLLETYCLQIQSLRIQKFPLKIGAAFHHPDDKFIKKEGRKIAISRMENVDFTINCIERQTETELFLQLTGKTNKGIMYYINTKIYADSRKLRVMSINTFDLEGA